VTGRASVLPPGPSAPQASAPQGDVAPAHGRFERFRRRMGIGGRRGIHMLERNAMVYRHTWLILLSGFFEPVFFLVGMGFGLGGLVGGVTGPGGATVPYAVFVAPALLASSAMNGAITEGSWNFFWKFREDRFYETVLSTPLSPDDLALGELAWALVRGGLYSTGFLVIMVLMGLVQSPWALLALPAALVVGFGFGGAAMGAATFMRTWQDLDVVSMVTVPMLLLSGTFYPMDVYPDWLRTLIQLTPLYQGVDMLRALTTGAVDWSILVHVAYLVALGLLGLSIVGRRVGRTLLK
jgi:lipooligosaccharide transport system permease protein